ncbi:MAG: hypothetical protein RLZZ68_431 [Bacteroidota bacterium]
MKKSTFVFVLSMCLSLPFFGQVSTIERTVFGKDIPTLNVAPPNVEQLLLEDQTRDELGLLYRNGVARTVNISPMNSGSWSTLPNGDRQWSLRVKSPGAEALSFLFETFKIYGGTTLEIRNNRGMVAPCNHLIGGTRPFHVQCCTLLRRRDGTFIDRTKKFYAFGNFH